MSKATIDTEEKILNAAKEVFVQKGFAGARMQEIADKAEINKALLHYYFRTKQQLFDRILMSNIGIMAPRMVTALMYEGTIIEKFENLIDSYIDTISEHPQIPMFLLHELTQNGAEAINMMKKKMMDHELLPTIFEQVQKEQEAGILKSIPPHQMMFSLMSLIVFPFIAKPIFKNMLDFSEENYSVAMQDRKQHVKQLIRNAFMK